MRWLGFYLFLVVAAQAQSPPTVEIRPQLGRPTVFVNDQPLALAAYSPVGPHRMALFHRHTARFFPHQLGAYLISIGLVAGSDWGPAKPDQLALDDDRLDTQVAQVLAGDPGAWLIIRFGTHESAAWRNTHPDELFVTDTGVRLPVPSLASDLFNQACSNYAAAVIAHCEAKPWANRIIGYANFLRMEGTHEPIVDDWLFDHSPAMQRRFGKPVPTDKLRGPAPDVAQLLYWQTDPQLRDYLLLQRDLFREHFRMVTAAMRQAAPRNRFLLYDALKQPMLGWSNGGFFQANRSWPLVFAEDRAASGHTGVAPLLDLPGVDGLITPHDYQARGIGGVYQPEGAADSTVLRGKLMFCEMDTRTWAGHDGIFRARDIQEFAAITWRNIADGLTRGYQSYWMDLYEDWFTTPAIHEVIDRQVAVLKESVKWPHADVPGIAMILDDEAVLETNGDGRYFNEAIMWEMKQGLARCGVPFRVYLLDDLKRPNFPAHRVFYFPNLFRISAARRALLQEKVFKDGHVVVWGPGSGIAEGGDATGFTFDRLPINYPRRVLVSNFEHPITRGLPADTIIGSPFASGPVLLPKDGTRLGEAWTKAGQVAAGLAVKEMTGWQSVFTTAVPLPADLWRGLARYAGAHVYSDENDVLLADASVVAVHSVKSGHKCIRLPEPCRVRDAISGQMVTDRTSVIEFELTAPATRVFQLTQ